ncbi:MAG TPA: ABC transporter permease [Steroidobacteraceae bacterium]|jgi:putative ABC transport system permease protein|nr:ABC transporter permease [Steroidobacteraceae bacterium]
MIVIPRPRLTEYDIYRMKFLPLVWAALRRHTVESLLTLIVLTIAFTLLSSMAALRMAYDDAIHANRMDRLLVTGRFSGGSSIARRDEIARIPGVRGVMAIQWVWGFHQAPSMEVGVSMVDGEGIAAVPELPVTLEHWKHMAEKPTGVFFTRSEAAKWNVKTGDIFPVQTSPGTREDGANAWPFEVLGIVDDPEAPVEWTPKIFGNLDYFDAVRTQSERGTVRFIVAVDDRDNAERICQTIDTRYANSEAPTYCVPLQVDARSILDSVISMREMSVGIAAAGLFMILFLCANSITESVRERIPELVVLKTIGFGDRQLAVLVFMEAALPCVAGAVLGTALARALGSFTSRLAEGSELPLPPPSISIWIVALALGVALLIGGVSALLPLRRLKTLELAPALAGR